MVKIFEDMLGDMLKPFLDVGLKALKNVEANAKWEEYTTEEGKKALRIIIEVVQKW